MASKQTRPPLGPGWATYVGLAVIDGAAPPVEARHVLRWASQSRAGKEHFSSCDERGGDLRCTCEWATHHGSCKHTLATLPTLAHFGVTFEPRPAGPGGAGRIFVPCARCPDHRGCARDGCRLFRRRDPGGAARDAAQAAVDAEIETWLPAALRDHMRRRFDEAVAADGDRWTASRTAAGVRLTCVACHAVRGWASEGMATAWLEGGGRCGCAGPTPPAPGAARKPLGDDLSLLYGDDA